MGEYCIVLKDKCPHAGYWKEELYCGIAMGYTLEENRDKLTDKVDAFHDLLNNEDIVIFTDSLLARKMTNELAFANNASSNELLKKGFVNAVGDLTNSALFKNQRMGKLADNRIVRSVILTRDSAFAKWTKEDQDLRKRQDNLDKNLITEYRAIGGVGKPERIIVLVSPVV